MRFIENAILKTLFTCISGVIIIWMCEPQSLTPKSNQIITQALPYSIIDSAGTTISSRFSHPSGFVRTEETKGSFPDYLRNLKLKPAGTLVQYHDGSWKSNHNIYDAVLDQEISEKDLHQCADAIIRLRAEYLYSKKAIDSIAFNLTNGHRIEYSRWVKGERISVKGNNTRWIQKGKYNNSPQSLNSYLDHIYMYAGTQSLSKELTEVKTKDIRIGDVFIQGGFPGHAILIVDMAINHQTGEKAIMLGQSYMPAQEFQILKNNGSQEISPWYIVDDQYPLITPEWNFEYKDLKRF